MKESYYVMQTEKTAQYGEYSEAIGILSEALDIYPYSIEILTLLIRLHGQIANHETVRWLVFKTKCTCKDEWQYKHYRTVIEALAEDAKVQENGDDLRNFAKSYQVQYPEDERGSVLEYIAEKAMGTPNAHDILINRIKADNARGRFAEDCCVELILHLMKEGSFYRAYRFAVLGLHKSSCRNKELMLWAALTCEANELLHNENLSLEIDREDLINSCTLFLKGNRRLKDSQIMQLYQELDALKRHDEEA